MKINLAIAALAVGATLYSCGQINEQENSKKEEPIEKNSSAHNVKEVCFKIDGMTCAFGCAKTIEKKLAETQGVDSARIDFDEKLAFVFFNDKQQSKEELKSTIEALAGGDSYKATEVLLK